MTAARSQQPGVRWAAGGCPHTMLFCYLAMFIECVIVKIRVSVLCQTHRERVTIYRTNEWPGINRERRLTFTTDTHSVEDRCIFVLETVGKLHLIHSIRKWSSQPTLAFLTICHVEGVTVQQTNSRTTPVWRILTVVVGWHDFSRSRVAHCMT